MRTGLLVVITILAAPLANQVLPGTGGHTFAARAQSVEGRIEDRHKFENPRVNGQVVDRCLNSTSNCEQPAADNFCRLNGYAGAVYFRLEYTRPTLVVADNKVCNDKTCQGFTAITCANERHFDEPQINGRAVDRCLNWGQNCEQPAADNFCRLNGYARAASFRFADMPHRGGGRRQGVRRRLLPGLHDHYLRGPRRTRRPGRAQFRQPAY